MNKPYLLLAMMTLIACASGCSQKEATQTVVEVRADAVMKELVTSVAITSYSLRDGAPDQSESEEVRAPVATWPVRRTYTVADKGSRHRFRMELIAYDAADNAVANFSFQSDIVDDVTRYVSVRLSDMCRPEKCAGGVCVAAVDPEDLGKSFQQAFCGTDGDEPSTPTGDADMTMTGSGRTDVPGDASTAPGSMTTSGAPGSAQDPAANGGTGTQTSGQAKQDAGVLVPPPPPSKDAECLKSPCGAHGYCSLKSDAPNKYVCTCETGYAPNDSGATCVVRNDCNKDNGGCEGACEPVSGTGEAKCSCQGNSWLKGDGKGCAEPLPELQLSTSSGSKARPLPQVAFDSMGNGVVAWTEVSDDGVHSMWSARYSADSKTWEKPMQPFARFTTNAADLHLALDASGSGLLLWTATVNSHRQLWSARYRNNAFAAVPKRIDDAGDGDGASDVLMPSFALDSVGDGLIAWSDFLYPSSSLRAARFSASSNTFTTMAASFSASSGSLVVDTSVALHSNDVGLIAWTDVPASTPDSGFPWEITKAAAFNANVGLNFGNGVGFGSGGAPSTSPDIAMDAEGRGIGVWLQASDTNGSSYKLQTGVYIPGAGWTSKLPETLADDVGGLSAPHIALAADGSGIVVWRVGSGSDPMNLTWTTRAAARAADKFETPQDLGLPSNTASWNDLGDTMNWTAETTVKAFDLLQPQWDLAAGPFQSGFVVGSAFDTSSAPAQRSLWLQRVASNQEPSRIVRVSDTDAVPARPSQPRIGINANGDGALVWDRQVDGHFYVYASLLQ